MAQHEVADLIQIIGFMAVVASLIATLSYTGVLTPAVQLVDCNPLCGSSIYTLVLANTAAQYNNSINTTTALRQFIEENNPGETIVHYSALEHVFVCFNGLALVAALSVVLMALYTLVKGINEAEGECWKHARKRALSCGIANLKWLLATAVLSALIAFVIAHFNVWYMTATDSYSVWVVLGLAGSALLLCGVLRIKIVSFHQSALYLMF